MKRFKAPYSILSILILLTIVGSQLKSRKEWKNAGQKDKMISWDVTSYYGYLPAAFIHQDLELKFIEGKEDQYAHAMEFWPERAPNGGYVIKTTMGLAYLYAPFFYANHLYALNNDLWEADGFSVPYERGLAMSAFFYFFIGLVFLRKYLLIWFSDVSTAITIILIVLGTNLFYYEAYKAALSHGYVFSMSCAYLYVMYRWRQKGGYWLALFAGLLAGWLCLTRPTMLLFAMVPFLYIERSWAEEWVFIKTHIPQLVLLILAAIAVIVPQLLYWEFNTGHWIYFSYTGERFFFDRPRLLEFLLSYRKGWLVYSPLVILAFLGAYRAYRQGIKIVLPSIIMIIIAIYVLSSWWCWWFGGGFGMRSMIDFYALLAIPMATAISYVLNQPRRMTILLFAPIAALLCLSVFNNWQASVGVIHYDSMNKVAYWKTFLKTQGAWDDLSPPDYAKARRGEKEYTFKP